MRRRRIAGAVALAAVVATGLAVHLLLPDVPATDIAGDALYAVAVFAFLVILAPRWHPLVTGGVAVAWCVGVELFQLTGIPLALGAGFPPVTLVLGTVFDARDLVVYAAAIVVAVALDALVRRARGRA